MKQIDQQVLTQITKARAALLIDNPFFGTLAMRLDLVQTGDIPTLDIDGKTMRYNPEFVKTMDHELTKSAVGHEVMHCVLDHVGEAGRAAGLNPEKFNWAADYAVNAILKEAGFKLGEGWLYNAAYSGMTSEQIYHLIPDPPPNGGGAPSGSNPGPLDQVKAGAKDPAMAQQQAAEWKTATIQAANAAQAAGKLHGSLERFVDQLRQNKVDWREQLRRFMLNVAKNDYAWQRPNRKMLAAGYYLPGLFSEEMGPIYIASDESGSVSDEIMAAFGAEIDAIRQDMRPPKITLAHFAVQVGAVEEFLADDVFEMKRLCTGGTDFRPVMEHAESLAEKPICMIYLTDLYGPFPKDPPPFPVLWVCINKQVAPFGETIHIEI